MPEGYGATAEGIPGDRLRLGGGSVSSGWMTSRMEAQPVGLSIIASHGRERVSQPCK